jgi:hypothetical protein
MGIPTGSRRFADDSSPARRYAAVKKMLKTELTIVVFVAAIVGAALLPGCTFNVYMTDQVVYGTVTQESERAPNHAR